MKLHLEQGITEAKKKKKKKTQQKLEFFQSELIW